MKSLLKNDQGMALVIVIMMVVVLLSFTGAGLSANIDETLTRLEFSVE